MEEVADSSKLSSDLTRTNIYLFVSLLFIAIALQIFPIDIINIYFLLTSYYFHLLF